ncbi:MAG: glycosyltransferase [Candidatus Neomarinimicrobiota bacterium]|nr:glycosyltransferase [Candidatus Neomarinimicrobiota bacterium]
MKNTVSLLIVSYNVRQYIAHAIDAIIKSDLDDFEIIIIDNNSFDNTASYLKERYSHLRQIKIVQNQENIGFGKAINQAASLAKGQYYLILNPDTIIQEETISTLKEYLDSNPEVGMVGPKILNADGTLQLACKRSFPTLGVALPKLLGFSRIFPKSKWAGKYNLTYLDEDEISSVDAISGSCMFIRSFLFHELKGFDERFFMFGEDLDLCSRIWKNNYEIHYVPTTQIVHYQGESVKSAPFDSINAFYNAMILFVDKHFSFGTGWLMKFAIRCGIYIRKFFSMIGEKRSQILSVTIDAILILLAFIIAISMRFSNFEPITMSKGLIPAIYVIFWICVGFIFQLYNRYILSYSRAIISSVTGFFLAVAFTYFFKQYAFSRFVIIFGSAIISILIPGWRVLVHFLMARGLLNQVKQKNPILFTRKTFIVGADAEGLRIANSLLKRFDTGLELIGIVDTKLPEEDNKLPIDFIGRLSDLRDLVVKHSIRELIFSTSAFTNKEILHLMNQTKDLRLTYRMIPRQQEILLGKASIEDIGDLSFLNIEYSLFYSLHRFTKRIFDLTISFITLIIFSPIIMVLLLLKKGVQRQYWGIEGKKFEVTIFNVNSRFIRELPLFFAVLLGNLSLVGSTMFETSEPNPNLICQPGLTGLERIRSVKFNPEDRLALDHYYVQNQSFTMDLEIIMKTVFNN